MKRYKMKLRVILGNETLHQKEHEIIEDPNGAWVKWEDVTGLPDKWIRNGFGQWGVCTCNTTPCTCRAPICNCEKMSNTRYPEGSTDFHFIDSWICPAHGYKKR